MSSFSIQSRIRDDARFCIGTEFGHLLELAVPKFGSALSKFQNIWESINK